MSSYCVNGVLAKIRISEASRFFGPVPWDLVILCACPGVLRVGGIRGRFGGNFLTLRNVGLAVRPKRVIDLINADNYNGDALLEVLTKLSFPALKRIDVSNRQVANPRPGMKFVFRRTQLVP